MKFGEETAAVVERIGEGVGIRVVVVVVVGVREIGMESFGEVILLPG